jgi:hypothetical protein
MLPRLRRFNFRNFAFFEPTSDGRFAYPDCFGDVLLFSAVEPHVPRALLLLLFSLSLTCILCPRLHGALGNG